MVLFLQLCRGGGITFAQGGDAETIPACRGIFCRGNPAVCSKALYGEKVKSCLLAKIAKEHILAYLNSRNEQEVIVDPMHLMEISEAQEMDGGLSLSP